MACPVCQRPDPKLYRLPADVWSGPVPPEAVCFFCYLRLTGNRPTRSRLASESGPCRGGTAGTDRWSP